MQKKIYNKEQKELMRKKTAELFSTEEGQKILEFLNFMYADYVQADTSNANETFYRLGRASTIKELNTLVYIHNNKKGNDGSEDKGTNN